MGNSEEKETDVPSGVGRIRWLPDTVQDSEAEVMGLHNENQDQFRMEKGSTSVSGFEDTSTEKWGD